MANEHFPFHKSNDVQLINVINNQSYSLSVLNTLIVNSSNEADHPSHSVDHLSEPKIRDPVCDYIFCNELHSQSFSSNSLQIFSCNISSVPQHLDSLYDQC